MKFFPKLLAALSLVATASVLAAGCGPRNGYGQPYGSSGSAGYNNGTPGAGVGTPIAVSVEVRENTSISGFSQAAGDRYFLATITYDDGTVIRDTTQVQWVASDHNVAVFTAPGVLHPLVPGLVLVSAFAPEAYSNTLTLNVKP